MSVDRFDEGYQPDFDIDLKVGKRGEAWVKALWGQLANGLAEVKTDALSVRTRQVYIETACLGRDGIWHDSGITTTEADVFALVLGLYGRGLVLLLPTETVRAVVERAKAEKAFKECSRGSNPTKGVVVAYAKLISWLVEAA